MIESFDCDETKKIFEGARSRKFPSDIQKTARRKLKMIDAAKTAMDLKVPPNNKHEVLKGKWKDWHAIRINDQWRICFLWDKGTASRVHINDYH
jgi:toxin HigB-1